MHDVRLIRDDPTAFDAGLARRGLPPRAAAVIALDDARRAAVSAAQGSQTRRNELSRGIGQAKAARDEPRAGELMAEVARLKEDLPALEAAEAAAAAALDEALAALPNTLLPSVPDGDGEDDNVELKRWGTPPAFSFAPREHDALAAPLGMDFEAGAALSGARFTVLRGPVARLSRALGQFMLDRVADAGFEQVVPPLLVRDEAAFGTGQLPKFADDLFRTTDGRWLIPTAEIPLTNLVAHRVLAEDELPLRVAALTPCFRSEAGAAGRDTRGLIRQHQFEKVEMVSVVHPDASAAEHERMTAVAEGVLEALDLPYRRMALCAGDMGATMAATYDLEVWLPGQDRYREISSCSNALDWQARRMDARFRPAGAKGTGFVHTLNGSGLAVGRALVAVIENNQCADGSVVVPPAVRPYLGGLEALEPR
jgi:seryl-tRNA synthetase